MAANRFEQVDEPQADAINLTLAQRDGGEPFGIIHCPRTAAPDRLPADLTSPEVPLRQAVIGAITLANSKKIPIVVIDHGNLWNSAWGELWRFAQEDQQDEAGTNKGPV